MATELRQIGDEIWVDGRPLWNFGLRWLDIGTRMSVIRLPDGGLFLHSPVEADAATRAAIERLGPVRCIVAPNDVHQLFAAAWKTAYPRAQLLGSLGLPQKRPDLPFSHPTPASSPCLRRWTSLTRVRDGFGPNAWVRRFIRDRRAMRASIYRVLGWDFDRVTVTHGEVLEHGGRAALAKAYAWL